MKLLNDTNSPPITVDLTIDDIANSIERYFIQKTGIRPKEWIIPYIKNVFQLACRKFLSHISLKK
jgi:hypothetical protein